MRLIATLSFIACIAGCVAAPHTQPVLAPAYYGIWVQAGAEPSIWWEIRADSVVDYEISPDGKRCEAWAVIVIGTDEFNTAFGRRENVRLHRTGDLLVFSRGKRRAVYNPSAPQDICRKPDGTWLENAPYMVKKLGAGKMAGTLRFERSVPAGT